MEATTYVKRIIRTYTHAQPLSPCSNNTQQFHILHQATVITWDYWQNASLPVTRWWLKGGRIFPYLTLLGLCTLSQRFWVTHYLALQYGDIHIFILECSKRPPVAFLLGYSASSPLCPMAWQAAFQHWTGFSYPFQKSNHKALSSLLAPSSG